MNDLEQLGKVRNGLFGAGIVFGIMAAIIMDMKTYALVLSLLCVGCLAAGFVLWGMIAKKSKKTK